MPSFQDHPLFTHPPPNSNIALPSPIHPSIHIHTWVAEITMKGLCLSDSHTDDMASGTPYGPVSCQESLQHVGCRHWDTTPTLLQGIYCIPLRGYTVVYSIRILYTAYYTHYPLNHSHALRFVLCNYFRELVGSTVDFQHAHPKQ